MTLEDKNVQEKMLSETCILAREAQILWRCIRLHHTVDERIPCELVSMFEARIDSLEKNLIDIVSPLPF